MKKPIVIIVLLFIVAATASAQRTKKPVTIDLFRDTPVLFNPLLYPDGIVEKEGSTYLGNGRIVLKKIDVPQFRRYTEAEITLTLVSNGDPWDKAGSCFLITPGAGITMLDIAASKAAYPMADTTRYDRLRTTTQPIDEESGHAN